MTTWSSQIISTVLHASYNLAGIRPDRLCMAVLYVVAMVAGIAGADLAFFRDRFWNG